MNIKYIIVQAGGRGSRMESLTKNKPKALVPVDNLPMIFHLFNRFPGRRFLVIGDYKYDVLEKYLFEFAREEYRMVCAQGKMGTCAGLGEALELIPEGEPFLLIWCDLVLPEDYVLPDSAGNVIGIAKDFPCRWKYENGSFEEVRSTDQGVAGHFIFQDKSWLRDVPEEGEFVRWLQDRQYTFEEQPLYHTREYGLYGQWVRLPKARCRPFNRIRMEEDRVWKTPLDEQGRRLAEREAAWYRKVQATGFENIPEVFQYLPLCMERVEGKNIYEYQDISLERKREILRKVVDCLRKLHGLENRETDPESYYRAYIEKTYERLEKVRRLVPFADEKSIQINGRSCRNVLFCREELEGRIMKYLPESFCMIHGDCTFSNIILRQDGVPILIDPRGYFGSTKLYGDSAYDWAKLYYSLKSNYDQFNLKRFRLEIMEEEVKLEIASNQWEMLDEEFFRLVQAEVSLEQMQLLLGMIWLSLTTYAWEDYDSICGAFYNGLYILGEVL